GTIIADHPVCRSRVHLLSVLPITRGAEPHGTQEPGPVRSRRPTSRPATGAARRLPRPLFEGVPVPTLGWRRTHPRSRAQRERIAGLTRPLTGCALSGRAVGPARTGAAMP